MVNQKMPSNGEVVTSRCLGSKFLVLRIWQIKTKEIDMHDFPVHDCTREPNSSPYFSSIVRPWKEPSLLFTSINFASMVR